MSKRREMQRLIRVYKDEMNGHELDMHKGWAAGKGWPLPIPPILWISLQGNLLRRPASRSTMTRTLGTLSGLSRDKDYAWCNTPSFVHRH